VNPPRRRSADELPSGLPPCSFSYLMRQQAEGHHAHERGEVQRVAQAGGGVVQQAAAPEQG
jgi:hypothetical protein